MPRIALVGPSWPFRGGIARTTTHLAATLDEREELARFVVPVRQYPAWLYPGGGDRDPAACVRVAAAEPRFGVLEPWTWWGTRRALRRSGADAVAVPYWTWAWAPMLSFLLRGPTPPAVAIVHNPADHDSGRLHRFAARRVLARCRGFLCHAASVAEVLARELPGRPVAVHPLPADRPSAADRDAARTALGLSSDAVAVLCFGLIRPYKGIDVLLDAVRALPAGSPVVLLLAGEPWGDEGDRIRAALADPALSGRVRARLEWVPEQEAAVWFAAADAAVLPYRAATGSAVAAQMLGHGLPVVASRVGGLVDVVEDGRSGLLVPPEDAGALAAALARVSEAGVRGRLAAGARAAASQWSWDSYADALAALVDTVVRGAPARTRR